MTDREKQQGSKEAVGNYLARILSSPSNESVNTIVFQVEPTRASQLSPHLGQTKTSQRDSVMENSDVIVSSGKCVLYACLLGCYY